MKIPKSAFLFLFLCLFMSASEAQAVAKTSTSTKAVTQAESEKRVREYFKDIPVMIEIARCESNFRQFTDTGNVLRGGDSSGMVGVFQFFESIHAVPAKTLGFDITTLEGNLSYARHLYKEQNTVPWEPARSCWEVKPTTIKTPSTRTELQAKIKQLTELIKVLRRLQELKSRQK